MSIAKKTICLLLTLILCMSVCGCQKQNDDPSENPDDGYVSDRELAEKDDGFKEDVKKEYVVEAKDFDTLNGYVVVYPKGNEQLRQAANKLSEYFKKNEIEVTVSSDDSAKKDKEILLGDTNRGKSELAENKYAVSVDGDMLFFESGNFNGVIKAVSWFTAQPYEILICKSNKQFIFYGISSSITESVYY